MPAQCLRHASSKELHSFAPISWLLVQTGPHDEVMPVPTPRFQRIATLIAIDSEHRVALLRAQDSASPTWELPQRRVGLAESYSGSVTRLAGQLMSERSVRWGTVTGRLWAPLTEGNATHTEVRYFIARISPAPRSGFAAWLRLLGPEGFP